MNTDDPDHSAYNVVSASCTPGDKQESLPNFTVLSHWATYIHNGTDSVLGHQKIHAWQTRQLFYVRGVNVVQPLKGPIG